MAETELTRILERAQAGDTVAHEQLFVMLYDELRAIAQRQFAQERANHTLQSTALVHEAWIRLLGETPITWQSRSHFLAVAATAMRRILIDHARRVQSQKRGGDSPHFSLTVAKKLGLDADPEQGDVLDLIDLEAAMTELGVEYPEHARIVEMRFFGGATAQEVAEVLGVTERTIERKWRFARAWLFERLESPPDRADSE